MNRRFLPMLCAGGLILATALVYGAGSAENPYTPIVTRNVFGLVPIPNAPPADTTPATPPPKITPNGITTILGKVQALFKVAGIGKPGQPPKDEFYILGEGERQDDIEVQKIDEKAAMITFDNHGTIQTLPLVVGTATGGIPAPAAPGVIPGSRPTIPTVAERATPPTIGGFGGRLGRNHNSQIPGNPGVSGGPGFGGAGTVAPPETLSPEAKVIMMEAQRAQFLKEGNPAAAIIPTTPITQEVIGGGQPAGGGPAAP